MNSTLISSLSVYVVDSVIFSMEPEMPADFRKWIALLIGVATFSGVAALLLILL